MTSIDSLKKSVKDQSVVLFVGAGISASLGIPTYSQLMEHIAEELGYDAAVFTLLGRDYLELAEYYQLQTGSIGPLRSWMDREWDKIPQPISESKIHQLIVELDFPIIYTTNYDRWLERTFDHYKQKYVRIATVKDLTKANGTDTQIVKFHGDFDHDDSIVLTETSFFERLDFESPMDLKLRSDCLGRSLLFLGYGLADINLRLLLFKLNRLWKSSAYASARPQSFLFSPRPNPVQQAILNSRGVTFISSDELDMTKSVEAFLESLKS